MAVNLSSLGGAAAQFFDNNGSPLVGGKLYTYAAGTTTPQATYTSSSGLTAHTNPIVLDSAGRVPSGQIWLTEGAVYKFVVTTSTGSTIATYDNIYSILDFVPDAGNVVYTPPYTASVATTVENKLAQTVSAKDFGAVGDGVTDDTAALQAAINYCFGSVAAPHGYALSYTNSALFIPKGTYRISDSLNIRSLIGGKIFGEGRFATTIQQTTANKAVLYTNGCGYTTFSDMHLQSLASNTGAIFDLNWDNTGGIALQSNTFSNLYFSGLSNLSVSKGLAIGLGGYQGSENTISNCFFFSLNYGLYTANFNALQNIVVGGNFQSCRFGIYVAAGSVTNVYGTGFQNDSFSSGNNQITEGGSDIYVANSVSDQIVAEGCRSESMQFGSFNNGVNAKLSNNSMTPSRIQPWSANASYSLGAIIAGTGTPYICTTAGTSGSTEPTWSGATVADNTVVWTLYNYAVVSGARTYDRNIFPFGQIANYDNTTIFTGNFFSRADFLSGNPYQASGGPLLINNVNQYPYFSGAYRESWNYNEYSPTWTPTFNISLGPLHGLIWPSYNGKAIGFARAKNDLFDITQNSIGVEGVLSGRSVSGTDVAGNPLYIAGGPGTGAGAPGSIVFRTPTVLATGTTVQDFTTRMTLKGSGALNMVNATTYANNAAALAGGLVAGDVYKTAAGELRIVV